MLAVYDVAHSLPLGGIGKNIPVMKMRPETISHTSRAHSRNNNNNNNNNNNDNNKYANVIDNAMI